MIIIDGVSIDCKWMGLFTSDKKWIHPERIETTYEIILVTEGTVYLEEENREYILEKGDLIVLKPNVTHKGSKYSVGRTSFFWVHFTMDSKNFENEITITQRKFPNAYLFKELLHSDNTPNKRQFTVDAYLVRILAEILDASAAPSSKIANDIFEWVRINASANLTVEKIGEHFRYNPEYVSRLIRAYFKIGLKKLIDSFILSKAKNLLCNSNYSAKEISTMLNFTSSNVFINFFKYHENTSPAKYRNIYSKTHLNNK